MNVAREIFSFMNFTSSIFSFWNVLIFPIGLELNGKNENLEKT